MTEYVIVPRNEVAAEINATSPSDAMINFAWQMDTDMSTYFMAIPKDEYKKGE